MFLAYLNWIFARIESAVDAEGSKEDHASHKHDHDHEHDHHEHDHHEGDCGHGNSLPAL